LLRRSSRMNSLPQLQRSSRMKPPPQAQHSMRVEISAPQNEKPR